MLAGCGCLNSPQAMLEGCTSQACYDRTAAPLEITPAPFTPSQATVSNPSATRAKPKKVAKTTTPLSAKTAPDAEPVEETTSSPVIMKPETPPSDAVKKLRPASPAKTDVAASAQPADMADTVLKKARTKVAARMEDPTSAEFEDMKRAMRKNTFGNPVDTICGHVKGKKTSGEAISERPFLYLVKEDEVYLVDGNPESAAATAYRNICINLDVRGKESRQH